MFSARSLPSFRAVRPARDWSSGDRSRVHRAHAVRNAALVTIVSAFVFLTTGLFALALRPLPAALVILGCLGGAWLVASRPRGSADDLLEAPLRWRRLALCIGLATGLMLLGGETHVFHANLDWHIRDAVLSDLVRHGMTTLYRVGDANYVLRAPLGMYIVPSLVGRLYGLMAAHGAMLAQNALFLGAIFYLLSILGRGWLHLAILVLFAGLVIVPDVIWFTATHTSIHLTAVLDSWISFWQYSSSMVQFFWVPNHALPGWWLATLLLLSRRSGVDEATLGVTVAALVLWSPLAVVPIVPWLLYRAAIAWRAIVLAPRTWCGVAIAACFTPILLYLLQGWATITHGNAGAVPDVGFWYPFFILVQLPALFFSLICWRHVANDLRALLVVNGLVLLLLPLLTFGPSNDLVLRGSIVPLTIIAFVFGVVVFALWDQRAMGAFVGLTLIVATLPSATSEILRAILLPREPISACTLMEAANAFDDKRLPTNYVVAEDHVPPWLLQPDAPPIVATPGRVCAPPPSKPS